MNIASFDKPKSTIVSRGLQYYKSGAVSRPRISNNIYKAIVSGTERYEVTVDIDAKGVITNEDCTCPYPDECKHIFALLYYIRDKFWKKEDPKAAPTVSQKEIASENTQAVADWFHTLSETEQIVLALVSIEPKHLFSYIAKFVLSELWPPHPNKFNKANKVMEEIPSMLEAFAVTWPKKFNKSKYKSELQIYPIPSFRHYLLPLIAKVPEFEQILQHLQRKVHESSPYPTESIAEAYFSTVWYVKNQKLSDRLLRNLLDMPKTEIVKRLVLNELLEKGRITDLGKLSEGKQYELLAILEQSAFTDELSFSKYLGVLAHPAVCNLPGTSAVLARFFIASGNEERLNALLSKTSPDTFGHHQMMAHKHLSAGEFDLAGDHFMASFGLFRKFKGKRSGYPHDMLSLYFPLASALSGVIKYQSIANEFIDSITDPNLRTGYARLMSRANDPSSKLPLSSTWFNNLSFSDGLIGFWIAQYMGISPDKATLEAFGEWAKKKNLQYFKAELDQMVASEERAKNVGKASVAQGSFWRHIQQEEGWKLSLRLLEKLTKKPDPIAQTQTTETDIRLAWIVNFIRRSIETLEQKRITKGWSAGKPISMIRLKEQQLQFLTEQDRQIIHYALQKNRNGLHYSWEFDEAVIRMAGHPNVFNNQGTPIHIFAEVPRIIVEEDEKETRISVVPYVLVSGIHIRRETETRYHVSTVTEKHLELIRALGGPTLIVPAVAKEQARQVIKNLSGVMPVHSDATDYDEEVLKIRADSRPVVQLMPVNEGFLMEIFVKPLGEAPPYFKPGKGSLSVMGEVDGKKTVALRNHKEELVNWGLVKNTLQAFGWRNTLTCILDNDEHCLEALLALHSLQQEELVVVEWPKGEKLRIHGIAELSKLELNAQNKQDWFQLTGEVRVEEETVMELKKLMDKLRQQPNVQFLRLDDGRILALSENLRKRIQALETVAYVHKNELQINALAALSLEHLGTDAAAFGTNAQWLSLKERFRESQAKTFYTPEGLEATLRPYQEEGYQWLCRLSEWGAGACLADDMGLGKTVQCIALLLQRASLGPTIVVAPTSVVGNWANELARFGPSLNPILILGQERAPSIQKIGPGDVLICSYGILVTAIADLAEKKFATIVLDEAHSIKNRLSKRAAAAMRLHGDCKIAVTGTPLENHLGELWSLFQFINPGLLGTHEQFREKFALPIERERDVFRREALKKLIAPFILRRRKEQVAKELPSKTEICLSVELSAEERAFYEATRRSALERIHNLEGENDKRFQILAELTRMRQAACNPNMLQPELGLSSSKLNLFGELVSELIENKHRALVFSQFVKHLSLVKEYLDSQDIAYQYLDGSTPQKDRQALVDKFQAGEGDLFLISLKAGGTGLNLTAADFVIHLDPWWNPAVEDQASDRAHRIGQLRPVTVYRLVSEHTVEDKIMKLHETKRDLVNSLLEDADLSGKLSAAELLMLLQEGGN